MVITILIKQLLHQVHFKSLRSDRHRLIERTFINVKIIHAVHDMHFPVFAVLYPKHSPITGSPVIYSFKNFASNKKKMLRSGIVCLSFSPCCQNVSVDCPDIQPSCSFEVLVLLYRYSLQDVTSQTLLFCHHRTLAF